MVGSKEGEHWDDMMGMKKMITDGEIFAFVNAENNSVVE